MKRENGIDWACTLLEYHEANLRFLVVHHEHGVVHASSDEDSLQAFWNDLLPSTQDAVSRLHTNLFVVPGSTLAN